VDPKIQKLTAVTLFAQALTFSVLINKREQLRKYQEARHAQTQ
jgi:hypothetical protein